MGGTAATTLNLGDGGTLNRTINIGTGNSIDTINIGTGTTGADVINIGSTNAGAVTIRGGTNSLIDFPNFDVATTGNITTVGTLNVGVGSSFQVDANGNIIKLNGVTTSFLLPRVELAVS